MERPTPRALPATTAIVSCKHHFEAPPYLYLIYLSGAPWGRGHPGPV